MFWPLIAVLSFLFVYYFLVKPQRYWSERNVKQGVSIPLLGSNFKTLIRQESMIEMVRRIYNEFKNERYIGMYQFTIPTLLLKDPDLIKQITVKDFDHFVDHRSFSTEYLDPLWTKNLFVLKGDEWREMRATLSPSFTSSKMRAMFVLMEKSARQYVEFYLDQQKNMIELELKDSFTRFANDVIANCAFGISVNSLKEPENAFYLNGKEITNFSGFWKLFKFFLTFTAPKLANFLKLSIFLEETAIFFKKLVHDTVKMREEQNIVRPDMINLLMEARKGRLHYEEEHEEKGTGFATVQESAIGKMGINPKKRFEMTETDMAAQALIFFAAGFDTISTLMSFMCYELAVHPDIQEKLHQEIKITLQLNESGLTYDILGKMKYMDMVISESLRKVPPAVAMDRVCTKPYTIQPEKPTESPVHMKPGDVILLPIAGIHYDEKYYPNPDKFDPERFSDENKSKLNAYNYMPFGSGPRNCIGSRFALMEVKTPIFHILDKFELVVIPKTIIPMQFARDQINPIIKGGFWVGFKRRENGL